MSNERDTYLKDGEPAYKTWRLNPKRGRYEDHEVVGTPEAERFMCKENELEELANMFEHMSSMQLAIKDKLSKMDMPNTYGRGFYDGMELVLSYLQKRPSISYGQEVASVSAGAERDVEVSE